jgi:hypothetical protein
MDVQRFVNRETAARRSASFLGWFSIGLGMAELFAARPMARMLGMRGNEGLLRLYGLREIAAGVGIFAAEDKAPWVWGRVAGDALDIATLAAQFEDNPRKGALVSALAAVAGVTVLDVMTAQALATRAKVERQPERDYSDRSGFPMGVEAARGIAAKDFKAPSDMRLPPGMEPRQLH